MNGFSLSNISANSTSNTNRIRLSQNSNIRNEDDDDDDRVKETGAFACCPCITGCIIALLLGGIVLATLLTFYLTSPKTTISSTTIKTTTILTSSSTTTTTTTVTTTTTTTTTTAFNSCVNLRWNQTGVPVANSNTTKFTPPRCIRIDANDTIYICQHTSGSVKAWYAGASSATTVTDSDGFHADFATIDKNGLLYISTHANYNVQRYSPGSLIGTVVAGSGSSSSGLNSLINPLGLDVDDNLNVYVADQGNKRVVQWSLNATNGILLINVGAFNPTALISGLVLAYNTSNQLYLSDENSNNVYLWTFGAASPNVTLNQVRNDTNLITPRDLIHDPYGNLYVAENSVSGRIVMYCINSTIGEVVIDGSGSSTSAKISIDFDSNLNLYALLNDGTLMKYSRL